MAFASVMVPLDPGPCSADRLQATIHLAAQFGSRLIGVAARETLPTRLYGKGAYINPQIVDLAYACTAEEMASVEETFHRATAEIGQAEWRSARKDPMAFLMKQSRSADLVVVSRDHGGGVEDWCSSIDPGELILNVGRPVLVVPPTINHLSARRIIVAWKDTREARRAISDGLPFLKAADEVFVVSVGEAAAGEETREIAEHLKLHGVTCGPLFRQTSSAGVAAEILTLADEKRADLIVAGAYGHSRMREMIFGSVTQQLLESTPLCCLMSH
ncbi:universal stress protein [Methylobacterium nigriterrae]|uniref:universal stress protein n=1 Tax=Methylobacterium nigriterrae TaxID=3127512 RepID=UPI00301375E8